MALVAMVIMPNVAWGQGDYPVKIGDTQLNAGNISNFPGVSYEDATRTLTLSGANLTAPIVWSHSSESLKVIIEGENTITTDEPCISANSGNNVGITFEKSGTNDASLTMTSGANSSPVSDFYTSTLGDGLYIQSNEPGTNWSNFYQYYEAQGSKVTALTITSTIYYPIWVVSSDGVSYIQVNDANKSHVLGDNNSQVTYNSDNDQLILNGFVCSTTGGDYAIVIGEKEGIKIHLLGTNKITGSGVGFAYEVASLVFSTGETPGQLIINETSGNNYLLASIGYDDISYENGLGFYNNTVSTVWPRLVIGNTQIMGTTDNVTGYENVSFDADTNTLTLSGATIENASNEPDIDVYVKDLIVAISGTNTVNGRFYGHYTLNGDNVGTIHFTKAEGATSPSITISGDTGDSGPVYEFSQCTWDNDLYLTEAKTAGGDIVPGVYYGSSRFTNGNTIPKTVKISTEPSGVILWIGEKAVTSANASNIFAEEGYLDGKVSFTVEDNKNVLILDGANLMEYPIVSDLPNLTIRFKEDCSLFTITSNKTNATLRFEKAEDASDGTQLTGSGLDGSLWSGFDGGVTFGGSLAYFANADTWYIYNLSSPKISIENNVVSFGVSFGNNIIPITNANDFNFFYTLQYEDENQQSVTTFTQYDPQNPLTINKASVLKVKARYKYAEDYSDVSIGKYFDSAENPMRLVYGADPVDLVLVPAIEESDGISILGIEANVTYNTETGKVSSTVLGTTGGSVAMNTTVGKTLVLNNYFTMNFEVVPPAPTISLAAGTYLDTHDPITITSSNLANTTIKYKWDDGTATDYPAGGISIQTGTLTAWEEHTAEGTTVSSDVTSVAYTVKTDLSNYIVDGLSESASYTGTAIELPAFTVKASATATSSLTAGTDYTVSYKKVGEGDALTDVSSMVDVGSYKIVITGTGNYGGSKMVDFEITKASLGIVTIEAIADQTYAGTAIELEGVTVKLNGETISANEYEITGYTNNTNVSTSTEKATVTIAAKSTSEHFIEGSTKTAEFNIVAKTLTEDMITLSATSLEYNDENQVPTVTVKDGENNLAGDDYEISYKQGETAIDEADIINANTYTVVVTGKRNYSGSVTKTFEITALAVAADDISVTFSPDANLVYDGTEKEPAITEVSVPGVANPDPIELTSASYDVEYSDNINAGTNTAKATITLKGNFSGSKVVTFTIAPKSIADADVTVGGTYTYTGAAITPAAADITVKDGTTTLTTNDYTISYENNIDAGTNTAKVIVTGKGNYDSGTSANGYFTIGQLDISDAVITLDYNELVYNGNEQTVSVIKVMVGDIEVPVDYYEVSGNTKKEAGDYTLIVTAKTTDSQGNEIKNNFTGAATKAWKIKNRTASAAELGLSDNQTSSTYYNNTENLELPDNVVAYIITGVSGSSVTTQRVSYIPKGVPVYLESGTSTQTVNDEIPAQMPLKGTAAATNVSDITGGTVYVLYKGLFVRSTTGTIPANRCYLVVSSAAGARVLTINHGDDDSTGIENITLSEDEGVWYDLRGRRIEKPTKKGIYILNGEKVVVHSK